MGSAWRRGQNTTPTLMGMTVEISAWPPWTD
jgi:hypothetical protein